MKECDNSTRKILVKYMYYKEEFLSIIPALFIFITWDFFFVKRFPSSCLYIKVPFGGDSLVSFVVTRRLFVST